MLTRGIPVVPSVKKGKNGIVIERTAVPANLFSKYGKLKPL